QSRRGSPQLNPRTNRWKRCSDRRPWPRDAQELPEVADAWLAAPGRRRVVPSGAGDSVWPLAQKPAGERGAEVELAADARARSASMLRLSLEPHDVAVVLECRARLVAR